MRSLLARVLLLFVVTLLGQPARAAGLEYRLGPQDQLQIKVYDLRNGTGEAYQWPAFNSEFVVSASGKVALPLVGELDAINKTTAELASEIADGLKTRVGLTNKPDASVQVTKFRPFYVLGDVDKPGEYEYRPDLSVLQAITLAGGADRVKGTELLGFLRDSLTSRGDLRALTGERLGLLARQARLDAEIGQADAITWPDELKAQAANEDGARLLREEQMLFDARSRSMSSQIAAIEQTKVVLQQEIAALHEKDISIGHQVETTQKELSQVTALVSKGLTVLPRQLEMEQSSAQFEGNRLDVAVATLKAQQDLSRADRDILELKNARRNGALQEATEVHDKLVQNKERIDTAQQLIAHVEGQAPAVIEAQEAGGLHPDYFITRRSEGTQKTTAAREDDAVLPGDVVRVIGSSKAARGGLSSSSGSDASRVVSSY